MQCMRKGFTLVELLVVIGIIGILIVALVPVVKGAQIKAKEVAVKAQCGGIETALANYAQNHGGSYPGLALDVMAPWADHALGDPQLYSGAAVGQFSPAAGRTVTGVIGGEGHANNSTQTAFQQLKTVKDTPLGGVANPTPRFFDSLVAGGATTEFPPNPFVTNASTGRPDRMANVFRCWFNIAGGFDPSSGSNGWTNSALYGAGIRTRGGGTLNAGTGGNTTPDQQDTTRTYLTDHYPLGVPLGSWSPATFSEACSYGTGANDFFAPGDFAYVPILSQATQPFGDSAATLENERYRWGTSVTGYMLFGYGDKSHKSAEFEDEKREFAQNGIPGFGGTGVDTYYESVVLQLFEGAIFYSKKY